VVTKAHRVSHTRKPLRQAYRILDVVYLFVDVSFELVVGCGNLQFGFTGSGTVSRNLCNSALKLVVDSFNIVSP
jgi:hypothetical protein